MQFLKRQGFPLGVDSQMQICHTVMWCPRGRGQVIFFGLSAKKWYTPEISQNIPKKIGLMIVFWVETVKFEI